MAHPTGDTFLSIQPDPPVAGQPAEITYTGSAKELDIYVDGALVATKKVGKDGKVLIDPVPHGAELFVYDRLSWRGYMQRFIDHLEDAE